MKTPEEIKRGLEYCLGRLCPGEKCPYYADNSCTAKGADALAYIQQLERERDALINIVKQTRFACWNCKRHVGGCTRRVEEISLKGDCFEWRGVEEDDQ